MHWNRRTWIPAAAMLALTGAVAWAVARSADRELPQADFTFCNGTEIKTVDPATVTGAPEGRIIQGIFEGLLNWDPQDLHPVPGVAERWEISDDLKTYTFHLRPDALWSNGRQITSDDFLFSFHRFLDPLTGAEYSYQLFYVTNAERYTLGKFKVGEKVEVELTTRPEGARPHARGTLLHGTLLATEPVADDAEAPPTYVVEVDGQSRRFCAAPRDGTELCARVMLDFSEVGIKALDPATLQITLNSPTPYFLSLMGFYPLSPVNRECLESFPYPQWTKPENIVTNGPFRLQYRRIRDRIRLVKSDNYWDRDRVKLNTIDALATSHTTTMLNQYLTGQADWITQIPNTILPTLQKQNRTDVKLVPSLAVYYYRINVTGQGPLSDKRIRRALALAVNRQEIINTVTRGGQVPATSFVPDGLPGYDSPSFGTYDPVEARRLLTEAGYPDGRDMPRVELMYNTMESHRDIAEMLQSQWRRNLGIEVSLKNQEWQSYLNDTQNLNYKMSRATWMADYNDPNTFLDMFVSGGANNQTGWSNTRYDALIAAAAREPDQARRMEMFKQAETILLDEMPVLPLYYYVSSNMVKPYVRGFYSNAQDYHPLDAISIDLEAKREFEASEETQ